MSASTSQTGPVNYETVPPPHPATLVLWEGTKGRDSTTLDAFLTSWRGEGGSQSWKAEQSAAIALERSAYALRHTEADPLSSRPPDAGSVHIAMRGDASLVWGFSTWAGTSGSNGSGLRRICVAALTLLEDGPLRAGCTLQSACSFRTRSERSTPGELKEAMTWLLQTSLDDMSQHFHHVSAAFQPFQEAIEHQGHAALAAAAKRLLRAEPQTQKSESPTTQTQLTAPEPWLPGQWAPGWVTVQSETTSRDLPGANSRRPVGPELAQYITIYPYRMFVSQRRE